jgi:hypothetical protein
MSDRALRSFADRLKCCGGEPENVSYLPAHFYDARAVAAGVAFCFTAAISFFAAGPDEAGFCPVIRKPSLTT